MKKRILIRKCAVDGGSAARIIPAYARFVTLETIAWTTIRATTQVRLINFPSQLDHDCWFKLNCRCVGDLLCSRVRFAGPALDLLLRIIQKIEKSILPQSLSNNDPEVPLLRSVSGIAPSCRLFHTTWISTAVMGILFDVCLLSITYDLCVACGLLLGRGKNLIII